MRFNLCQFADVVIKMQTNHRFGTFHQPDCRVFPGPWQVVTRITLMIDQALGSVEDKGSFGCSFFYNDYFDFEVVAIFDAVGQVWGVRQF
ncbi:hypothetical protein D3C81_776540 [compost metagenome]